MKPRLSRILHNVTPAEFDTRRRLLGLSIQETADFCGVQRRTVERWISGYSVVPQEAAQRMDDLKDRMKAAVRAAMDLAEHKPANDVRLIRYRSQDELETSPHAAGMPLGAHAMLIGWAAEALAGEGFTVRIEWVN